MTLIKELLELDAVIPYKKTVPAALTTSDPSRIYGVELEIEGVPHWDELVVFGMSAVEDGSLRNNGREFITKPTTFSILAHILNTFFNKAKLTADNYSDRTSVHVHANCQDLTVEQLTTVCLLYQVFEKLLFRYAGEDRDKNIFCVPWSETNLNYTRLLEVAEKGDINQFRSWQKYTALNLLPLFSLGTIEFRHLPGTNDVPRILTWVNLIGCLFNYATSHSLEEAIVTFKALNSNSLYELTVDNIFMEWAPALRSPLFINDLEEGVINFKYAFVKTASPERANSPSIQDLLRDFRARPIPPARWATIPPEPDLQRQREQEQLVFNELVMRQGQRAINPFERELFETRAGEQRGIVFDELQQDPENPEF